MNKLKINDRARIVGNDYSGHKFKTGSTVIITEVHQKNYRCRLEGDLAEWYVHPCDLQYIDPDSEARILDLEDDLAEWKRRVSRLNRVLDYALDYLQENDPVGEGMVRGYQDAMEALS